MNANRPSTAINLRRATLADAQAIQQCVCAAFAAYIERMDKAPAPMLYDYPSLIVTQEVWLAEQDGHVVGALLLAIEEDQFFLDTVASSPQPAARRFVV
ncbi:hypothetical protein [Pseudomonas sp. 5P_3.1_Bac2]|uniref:hypothetical protein n=1 Tax=Pseudomonas sp. 5P_3.1_Bac2 TaxID=2971617 RepID=UPI0021C670EE|nr:hypothetical protein [Pseudomonas sp. 5P_3.1_Bac2]MCU1716755.1 hypothetical protein [Pseudomonas sp. 5P_3.1_Bac2]